MPKSRGRKKKKTAKVRPRKQSTGQPDEVFERDGLRVERRGRMTYVHNTRTEEEHQEFLDSLPEAIVNMTTRISELQAEVISSFSKLDKIALLGGLNYNHFMKQEDSEDDGMAEVILEYGLSVAAALPNDQLPLPHGDDINALISAIKEIKEIAHARITAQSVHNRTNAQPEDEFLHELRFQTVLEALSIRGAGYYTHVRELFLELFSGHDDFLIKKYGFDARGIVDTAEELEKAFSARLALPGNTPHPSIMQRFFHLAMRNRKPPVMTPPVLLEFQRDHPEFILDHGFIATFSIDRIDQYEPLFRIRFTNGRQEKVVRALAMKFGDNHAFLEPPSNGDLLADTLIRTRPFIEADDKFYFFSLPMLSRYYLAIGQHLLENADDKKEYYRTHFLNKQYAVSRDNFIERKVEALFRSFLPSVQFISNVTYPLPDQKPGAQNLEYTELDLLGIGKKYTYLIEIKAGELNAAGKRGAIDSLVSRLRKNVSEGDYQSRRAYNYIKDTDKPVFKKGKDNHLVDKTNPVFRIVVTLDTFAGLLVSTSVLENANLVSAEAGCPWIVNILDLMVFADIIGNEQEFIDYLHQRLKLNEWKEFSTQDEINLLGHFLADNLEFDKRNRKLDNFMLNNHVQDIDQYYYARQNGLPASKPKRIRPGRK